MWSDVLDYALGEMGLKSSELWEMTWPEYEHAVTAYRTRIAQNWEPIRELYALYYNTHVEKADRRQPHELIPLYTDRPAATTAPVETPEAFWQRMQANNFHQKAKQKDDPTT